MDYGNLFSRAWQIIWNNKFLIVLGMLVVLTSASGSGGTQGALPEIRGTGIGQGAPQFTFEPPELNIGGGLEIALIVLIALLVLALVVAIWVISTIARGGLISGANAIDGGGQSSFGQAFSQGWNHGLRLLGISLVPAIPTLILIVVSGLSLFSYTGVRIVNGTAQTTTNANWVLVPVLTVICFLAFASLVLALLRTFANRACMLEDLGVIASYRRGLEVLGQNFGSALLLFLLQIGLSLLIGILLFLPGIVVALCCLLWPLLLIVQGTFSAYYSTLWTLAWARWTGETEFAELQAA